MATKKKASHKLDDLPGQSDAKAALDPALLLRSAGPVLKVLAEDLLARAKASPAVTAALSARHADEQAQERTADPYDVWLRFFTKQVAAAWFLSCVFVRVLEDRGLVDQHRLAGPGALDSQQLFFELAPSLSTRDYLLTVFRELSGLSAAADLFDARHNPVWLLAPSDDAAKQLLHLFRTPTANEPALRFGQADTRFLGDLYQDLDEDVRERFALLQTPHFVESFILDRTLERAIERFGLDDTTLIDPTCGSGHLLLGAFERLFEHRQRKEPGLEVRAVAHKALDAVYGSDINPYAVAIARFRLTLAFLKRAGYDKLAKAPKLPLHLAVADSLLHNAQKKVAGQRDTRGQQLDFGEVDAESKLAYREAMYALDDEAATRDVLYRQHAAVVGNPPYITVKDKALREVYRRMYESAGGKYSLGAPFTERFFQLAKERGFVGMITANSFMKREFGKKLIEDCLPKVNLDVVINTSGAYIPGHGTPTVLLFGTADAPQGADVLTVLAKRGEPSTPEDPEQGAVWSSIAGHWSEPGFENDYISIARTTRATLGKHPWSLGGGGAAELKELIEERSEKRLGDLTTAIGFDAIMGEDDLFMGPRHWLQRMGLRDEHTRQLCAGENVRDWSIDTNDWAIFPYDGQLQPSLPDYAIMAKDHFWRYERALVERRQFGKNTVEAGLAWFEYRSFYKSKRSTPLSITFAFVATHNHFVLDRGGKVFKQSAPIIKLPESATEDDHLALLAYLNSSTACFWMKQVCHNKTNASQKHSTDPARAAYEFAGTAIEPMPIPRLEDAELRQAAVRLSEMGAKRSRWLSGDAFRADAERVTASVETLRRYLDQGWAEYDETTARAAYLQEELDWRVYVLFGLVDVAECDARLSADHASALGTRPFEHEAGYNAGVSDRATRGDAKRVQGVVPEHWTLREPLLARDGIRVLEAREFKRMWRDSEQNVDQTEFRSTVPMAWLSEHLAAKAEPAFDAAVMSLRQVVAVLAPAGLPCASEMLATAEGELGASILSSNAIPFLGAHRYTDAGLEKRTAWERTWELQRREDAGDKVGNIPVPPKYDNKDFRDPNYFRLRGKLDVPKERFISYPGCESDEDREPVYGWAGWNHLQQAQALAALYQARKAEAWDAARLTPMLAGLLELLPWLKQWNNEPSAEFDGLRLGDYFEGYIDGECAALGVTRDELRAWRPTGKKAGAGKKAHATAKVVDTEASDEPPRKPRKKRAADA